MCSTLSVNYYFYILMSIEQTITECKWQSKESLAETEKRGSKWANKFRFVFSISLLMAIELKKEDVFTSHKKA